MPGQQRGRTLPSQSPAATPRYRSAVRFYGPALVWMGLLFLVHVQVWWAVFELRSVPEWTFFAFMLVLSIPTIVYLLAFLLLPDFDRDEEIDLRASYFEHRRWFFALFALLPLISLGQEYAVSGSIRADADPVFRVGFFALALVGFATGRERVHRLLAPAVLLAFAAYVLTLFLQFA